jgi:hypothetical protein
VSAYYNTYPDVGRGRSCESQDSACIGLEVYCKRVLSQGHLEELCQVSMKVPMRSNL